MTKKLTQNCNACVHSHLNREGTVWFEEISGAEMEDALEFIYAGSVEVTQENSKNLIPAANYLLIQGLKKNILGDF